MKTPQYSNPYTHPVATPRVVAANTHGHLGWTLTCSRQTEPLVPGCILSAIILSCSFPLGCSHMISPAQGPGSFVGVWMWICPSLSHPGLQKIVCPLTTPHASASGPNPPVNRRAEEPVHLTPCKGGSGPQGTAGEKGDIIYSGASEDLPTRGRKQHLPEALP